MAKELRIDLDRYRVRPGKPFQLASISPSDTQGLEDKAAAQKQLKRNRKRIAELQERLYAESKQALLLVLQAMDAGGKDSTIQAVTRGVNPQGCTVACFKVPSAEERSHDFLWRIHDHAPEKGKITIFNRSHYEDVLVVRVMGLAPSELVEKRYEHINAFEQLLHDHGTRILKVMLHISPAYQLEQFQERLEDPTKWWKFSPDDLEKRKDWQAYMDAFEVALNRCSTKPAPWHVVPAERKWFRTLAVSQLLRDTLEEMNPQYPEPGFDPEMYSPESIKDR